MATYSTGRECGVLRWPCPSPCSKASGTVASGADTGGQPAGKAISAAAAAAASTQARPACCKLLAQVRTTSMWWVGCYEQPPRPNSGHPSDAHDHGEVAQACHSQMSEGGHAAPGVGRATRHLVAANTSAASEQPGVMLLRRMIALDRTKRSSARRSICSHIRMHQACPLQYHDALPHAAWLCHARACTHMAESPTPQFGTHSSVRAVMALQAPGRVPDVPSYPRYLRHAQHGWCDLCARLQQMVAPAAGEGSNDVGGLDLGSLEAW